MTVIKITIILGKHLDRWFLALLPLIYKYSKSRNHLSNILWQTKARNILVSKGCTASWIQHKKERKKAMHQPTKYMRKAAMNLGSKTCLGLATVVNSKTKLQHVKSCTVFNVCVFTVFQMFTNLWFSHGACLFPTRFVFHEVRQQRKDIEVRFWFQFNCYLLWDIKQIVWLS